MVRVYRRHYRVRSKIVLKRKKTAGKLVSRSVLLLAAFSLLFLCGRKIYGWAKTTDTFEVYKINVTGLKTIPSGRFIECLPESYRKNFLFSYFVNFKKPIIRYFPQIKKVRIRRKIPHVIEFNVIERTPIACLRENERLRGIDSENFTFPLNTVETSLPVMLSAEANRQDGVRFLNSVLEKNAKVYSRFEKICVGADGNISFNLKDGPSIIWGRFVRPDVELKLKYLNDVLFNAAARFNGVEYIDLRMSGENRIIVKPAALKKT